MLERWRAWRAWTPPDELVAGARRNHRAWPGFPPAPLDLSLPPANWAAVLAGAYEEFDQLDREHFGGVCPPTRIDINPYLRQSAGLIHLATRRLDLNAWRLAQLPETRIETLFHEMIHLWLYTQGFACGHTPRFKQKMAERGHLSVRYGVEGDPKGPLHDYPGSDRRVVYRCPGCQTLYPRRRRYSRPMLCGKCLAEGAGRHRLECLGVARAVAP
ncbi:MAG: SprT-like domain-containing protein [Armatimonadetes bacterium]|nr:SprT-like domain-containing protein [Armatimonadota bacterium]